jgi:hypothetical protein
MYVSDYITGICKLLTPPKNGIEQLGEEKSEFKYVTKYVNKTKRLS